MTLSLYIFFFSGKGANSISWPWLSPPPGWGSLTMAFTGKFMYI